MTPSQNSPDEACDVAAVTVGEMTTVTQDYLKIIWSTQEWSDTKVTTKLLAEKLSVSPSTVSEAIRKLADQGLVSHARYGTVALTDDGRAAAVLMVRRHRLVETFLVRELGYGWDEVHDEAEVLEHAMSDRLVERLDTKLGHPTRDPHGDPIPSPAGELPESRAIQLADCEPDAVGRVARIADTDPAMLRYFDSVGITLDTQLCVIAQRPFAGTVAVTIDDSDAVDLGDIAARAIWLDLQ